MIEGASSYLGGVGFVAAGENCRPRLIVTSHPKATARALATPKLVKDSRAAHRILMGSEHPSKVCRKTRVASSWPGGLAVKIVLCATAPMTNITVYQISRELAMTLVVVVNEGQTTVLS